MSISRVTVVLWSCAVLSGATTAAQQQSQPAQASPAPSGIFLEEPGKEPVKLASSTTTDLEMKGVGKSILTQGILKPKQVVTHAGAQADLVVTVAQPSFLFRFPPPMNRNDPYAMMEAMAEDGLPFMSTHPKEFMLVQMTVVGDTRVLDSGKVTKAKFDIKNAGTREFRVQPSQPLAPGEWAFFLADQRRGGGTPIQIWAFSYRPND